MAYALESKASSIVGLERRRWMVDVREGRVKVSASFDWV